ncbi:hypothetical protein STHAL_32290 [Streptomyces halstedii]|uniref:Uncharacterized protein n=1 Tax=Streptomyces halstedii TaxID=1944 RepID=A0ABS6U0Q9_STRHA|nr:hypothetical protein [Streptomyces halstedii]MBV7674128.1 hypothetical protein [Streptomyces halstedii]
MSASTLGRTARPRRSRTRSRTVNSRPALALSTLKPHQYDLRPACVSLYCPDCETWVPITGIRTRKPKVVPHDTGRAGKDAAVRCHLGSNRLVIVDVTVKKWQERLEDGNSETIHRRPTAVLRKPQAAVAPAISQIAAQKQTASTDDEPGDGRPLWLLREMKWASTESAVRAADTQRAQLPEGEAPLGAPPVPLKMLRPKRRTS